MSCGTEAAVSVWSIENQILGGFCSTFASSLPEVVSAAAPQVALARIQTGSLAKHQEEKDVGRTASATLLAS
jgi:hypothetical protein